MLTLVETKPGGFDRRQTAVFYRKISCSAEFPLSLLQLPSTSIDELRAKGVTNLEQLFNASEDVIFSLSKKHMVKVHDFWKRINSKRSVPCHHTRPLHQIRFTGPLTRLDRHVLVGISIFEPFIISIEAVLKEMLPHLYYGKNKHRIIKKDIVIRTLRKTAAA